jgi:hypothetical protein
MRRTKIAPVLSALLDDCLDNAGDAKYPGDAQVIRIARAQFAALLAVAKAADEIRPAVVGLLAAVSVLKGGSKVEKPTQLDALDRALARIERASHPGEER